MIYCIARYYNTPERMTGFLSRLTNEMIRNCKRSILNIDSQKNLWDKDYSVLIDHLEKCIKLNEVYQDQYKSFKRKLQEVPSGKQFNFNEMHLFGKFDLFCRRLMKLIDMFSTINQFNNLAISKIEGVESVVSHFYVIKDEFRSKNHDLLDFHNNKFDRDYVEFNVRIGDMENNLKQVVNKSFDSISSINHSLILLQKFQSIVERESLKSDLDSKLNLIFQKYGLELEQVQQLYEKQKHDPPFPRNLPPVAGNISWSRHLLQRIEEPMIEFQKNQNVLAGKDAKRIIKMYNKVARTLVAFEFLWYKAWIQSIDQAKTGLQATLIIRHPDDNKLYVNFDSEILQLIRESKCLDRMGIEIPESAKIAVFQEEKFKMFYCQLYWALNEYDRIVASVMPVTGMIFRPHFQDMEMKLRPGMVTLTWTSMNIDAYINQVHSGLQKLDALVNNINDIIENRIEKNLKIVSKTLLVDIPQVSSISMSDFVDAQQSHIRMQSVLLQSKNTEVQLAVDDLIDKIVSYRIEAHVSHVSQADIDKLRSHYNNFMYQALLHSAKNSMNSLKKRIASRGGCNILTLSKPFFEVDIHLLGTNVTLSPSLDEIQECINRSAQAILSCYKDIIDWGYSSCPKEGQSSHSFFNRVTNDIELVRVALLLTGCIQGLRNTVSDYLNSFKEYEWLWMSSKDDIYEKFVAGNPAIEDYESQLCRFAAIHEEVKTLGSVHVIGALSLHSKQIKSQLGSQCDQWKMKYACKLHTKAQKELGKLTEYTRMTKSKLGRKVEDLDSLGFMMRLLKEIREKESTIQMEINPILDMYQLLESHLPSGFMEKEEIDKKTVLYSNWKKLVAQSLSRTDELSSTQVGFKRGLVSDISHFKVDVINFRQDFVDNGPMVQGLAPMDAVDRLSRFKEELRIRSRKFELYRGGEELFALTHQTYPDLDLTTKEIKLASQLFDLYVDVIHSINEWKQIPWTSINDHLDDMKSAMDSFSARCKKLPGRLREYDSFGQLRQQIEDYLIILPLLEELSKNSIKARHWEEVVEICGVQLDVVGNADFKLASLLEADLVTARDSIEEVTDGADKQLKIEQQLEEMRECWSLKEFTFQEWKDRGVHILKATPLIMEELEEAQMNLTTILTMRHVTPFRTLAQELLQSLSETSETLERWIKVQLMWCALESVFTGGDIAKQMPKEAKKFGKVDKDWAKMMTKASETRNVVECCEDELLRTSLPNMYGELEKCQKSLEGYLEQKQNAFPRFYFVSNAKLLIILSQGSDPLAMNEYYENVFDAIQYVDHDPKDKTIIYNMHGSGGDGHEIVPFYEPIKAIGNIEDWLTTLLNKMQRTMKNHARSCSAGIASVQEDITQLRVLVNKNISQFALLAIQIMWSSETQLALEQCRTKKGVMKENSQRQLQVLSEMSSWCLQDLGTKVNRKKIETLVTVHVHQRDIAQDLMHSVRSKKVHDANDFEWLKQARFYWRPNASDEVSKDGATIVSITDVDFNYQYEYLGAKERLVITPLTDKCYITLAQALGMYFGGAPAGPAGTGKVREMMH